MTSLDPAEPIFAVVARETKVEILLQAAQSYQGYKELLKAAPGEGPERTTNGSKKRNGSKMKMK